jgi:hypothetical protein
MTNIRLSDLAKVSNNSVVTNQVLNTLNEKLDDKEKRDFLMWLKIVEQNK